jgi:ubiquitin-protein ligase
MINNLEYLDESKICYNINDNNILIHYEKLKIYTNFKNYCYIEPDNEIINIKLLLLNNFNLTDIFNIINNDNKKIIEKINEYTDVYNFFQTYDEDTKIKIDYNLIEKNSLNYKETNLVNIKIPKELLFTGNKIREILLHEVKKINSNFEHEHKIEPINNIYNLSLKMKLSSITLEFEVKLNSKLYPFLPPKFELVKPNVKSSLKYALMNLDVLKLNNWVSTISLEWLIINIALMLDPIIEENIEVNDENNIIRIIEELEFLTDSKKINLNLKKFNISKKVNNFWKSGTGYGSYHQESTWNIEEYIQEKELKNIEIIKLFSSINDIILQDGKNIDILKNSFVIDYIINFFDTLTLLEIDNNKLLIIEINKLINIIFFDKILDKDIYSNNKFNKLYQKIKNISVEIEFNNQHYNDNIKDHVYQDIINLYNKFNDIYKELQEFKDEIKTEDNYLSIMQDLQFKYTELHDSHLYFSDRNSIINPNCLKRIISEISSLKKSLPINFDSSIWFRVSKNNVNIFTFLISGPKDTPYENGLFEFHAYLPTNYPENPPNILLNTTGHSTIRFNPNLYSSGKVCLSLLGTWQGNESEKWNPKTSTFLQVLISIQSLIFIENPYFNEPGYETKIDTKEGIKNSLNYNSKLFIDTLKWAINDQIINPAKEYEEIITNHFKLKKNDIINLYTKMLDQLNSEYKILLEEQINIFKNII